MLIFLIQKLIGLTLAGACTAVGVQEVNRKMTGSFVDDFVATSARGELARAAIDGSKGTCSVILRYFI